MKDLVRRKGDGRMRKAEDAQENPGQQGSSGHDIELKIQAALIEAMYLKDSEPEKFICKPRLGRVWLDNPVKRIPAFQNYSDCELQTVEREFLCVLSTLIFIGWDLLRFRPVFLRTGLDDSKLPFSMQQLEELRLQRHSFFASQSIFIPAVIEQSDKAWKQTIDTNRRLPFTEKPESLGQGGYGEVTKRIIAAGCLEEKRGNEASISNQKV